MVLLTHPSIEQLHSHQIPDQIWLESNVYSGFGSDLSDRLPRQLSGSLWVSKCDGSELFWLFAFSHWRAANQVLIITYEQLFTLVGVLTSKLNEMLNGLRSQSARLLIHKHTAAPRGLFCTAEWIYWFYFPSLVVRKQSVRSTRKNIWTFGKCS